MDTRSAFDKVMGELDGLPDVTSVRPAVIRDVPLFGIGGAQLYVVQTFRKLEEVGDAEGRRGRDVIFLEHVSDTGTVRLVIPPAVADCIARQRDQLSSKTRSKAAKARATARSERGERPAFEKRRGGLPSCFVNRKGGKK